MEERISKDVTIQDRNFYDLYSQQTKRVTMVDIGNKKDVRRRAVASGRIYLKESTIKAIKDGDIKKGDVLSAAEVSGIMAIKNTSNVIPLCHPIPLTNANIVFKVDKNYIEAVATVEAFYKTGVEMEALHGVSISLLTIWDMVKYLEKDENGEYPTTSISNIKVIRKEKDDK